MSDASSALDFASSSVGQRRSSRRCSGMKDKASEIWKQLDCFAPSQRSVRAIAMWKCINSVKAEETMSSNLVIAFRRLIENMLYLTMT